MSNHEEEKAQLVGAIESYQEGLANTLGWLGKLVKYSLGEEMDLRESDRVQAALKEGDKDVVDLLEQSSLGTLRSCRNIAVTKLALLEPEEAQLRQEVGSPLTARQIVIHITDVQRHRPVSTLENAEVRRLMEEKGLEDYEELKAEAQAELAAIAETQKLWEAAKAMKEGRGRALGSSYDETKRRIKQRLARETLDEIISKAKANLVSHTEKEVSQERLWEIVQEQDGLRIATGRLDQ